ncbi:MAG TPA: acyl-CoA reductase [Bacteroidales bacterium]|nr:acyl-CoA reductase [Bacteroidales bacterium]HBZ19573.1 acyl-CoA reductase [Bacteroidales bacterium]
MTLKNRIDSFSELGQVLRDSLDGKNIKYSSDLDALIRNQQFMNPWFTPENVKMAIKAIADELTADNLINWTSRYPALNSEGSKMTVGIVMAGNIPLAGFHDFLSVLISGHNLKAKTSSKDPELIVYISNLLFDINPEFKNRITLTDGLIIDFDMVIATGSNNTSRYFEYYFGKYPHIIRKNRNSIAIIEGRETESELIHLGHDVFSYFGLGCRSVSKIYLPDGYDLSRLITLWAGFNNVINHNKYANNYDFSKAVFLVNRDPFTDAGFLLFKESSGISSPVAVLYYEYYESIQSVYTEIEKIREKIQCIVGRKEVPFGRAQWPQLWDYADGKDTVDFLLKKN